MTSPSKIMGLYPSDAEDQRLGLICGGPAWRGVARHTLRDQAVTAAHTVDRDGMAKRLALIFFLSLVMLMSILGNLLVMVAVCKDRQLRKIKTNYFIVSLAFADLLVSVLVMPFGAIELVHQNWIYGETFCLVRTSLD
ncbi:hypothetical protein CRUP_029849, partial [Coryphaenoides rupestris]